MQRDSNAQSNEQTNASANRNTAKSAAQTKAEQGKINAKDVKSIASNKKLTSKQ
jgi:hypothetical protein